jgi:RecA/RadA recombinase
LSQVLPTGCKAIDLLLGGGVHAGMITDVYGEGGSGKTQLCFTICGTNAKLFKRVKDIAIVFVDTSGTFRPERITEIANDNGHQILDKILVMRTLSYTDQIRSVEKIVEINPELIIVDGIASLFTVNHHGIARHLALMNHLRKLSLVAINLRCPVIITNMVRSRLSDSGVPTVMHSQEDKHPEDSTRELMGTSVSIYTHMKLMLSIVQPNKQLFKAVLKQPRRDNHAYYTITKSGISDVSY